MIEYVDKIKPKRPRPTNDGREEFYPSLHSAAVRTIPWPIHLRARLS